MDKKGADDWKKEWDKEGKPSGDNKRRERGQKRNQCQGQNPEPSNPWVPRIPWKKVPGIVIRGGVVVLGAILAP